MARNTKAAFTWIIGILRKNKISFRITGGLAANIYGSNRRLADIDIEIDNTNVSIINEQTKKYVIYGPKRYIDKEFDLLLMTLRYRGQEIDICGIGNQKLFNKKKGQWELENIDLSQSVKKKVYNLIVPVISINNLIKYKKKILRDVDFLDVKALSIKNILL